MKLKFELSKFVLRISFYYNRVWKKRYNIMKLYHRFKYKRNIFIKSHYTAIQSLDLIHSIILKFLSFLLKMHLIILYIAPHHSTRMRCVSTQNAYRFKRMSFYTNKLKMYPPTKKGTDAVISSQGGTSF